MLTPLGPSMSFGWLAWPGDAVCRARRCLPGVQLPALGPQQRRGGGAPGGGLRPCKLRDATGVRDDQRRDPTSYNSSCINGTLLVPWGPSAAVLHLGQVARASDSHPRTGVQHRTTHRAQTARYLYRAPTSARTDGPRFEHTGHQSLQISAHVLNSPALCIGRKWYEIPTPLIDPHHSMRSARAFFCDIKRKTPCNGRFCFEPSSMQFRNNSVDFTNCMELGSKQKRPLHGVSRLRSQKNALPAFILW